MFVNEIKSGSKEAFREFFSDFYPILCSFAFRFLKDRQKSKDVAQEVLLKYWENRTDFSNISQVKGFLYVSTKNLSLNILKRENHNVGESFTSFSEAVADTDRLIIESETIRVVRKAVNDLPDRMREIVELTLMGVRNSDIADRLGIAEGTVHSLKKRAYKKLKEVLGSNFCLLLML